MWTSNFVACYFLIFDSTLIRKNIFYLASILLLGCVLYQKIKLKILFMNGGLTRIVPKIRTKLLGNGNLACMQALILCMEQLSNYEVLIIINLKSFFFLRE